MLLGMKKRGFGAGRWNGFGGKVLPEETIEAAAIRELKEETGLQAIDLAKVGIIEFSFASSDDLLEVHVFRVTSFSGTPQETEEMNPHWFKVDEIPFAQMWSDDEFWFPYFLANKLFRGTFRFDQPADAKHPAVILSNHLYEVETLS